VTAPGHPRIRIPDTPFPPTSYHRLTYCRYGGPSHPLPKCDEPDSGKEQTYPIPGRGCTRQYLRASRQGRASLHRVSLSGSSAQLLVPFSLAQVPQPIATLPTEEQFWMNDQHGRRKPNADFLRHHFIHEGRLTEDQAVAILRLCKDLLASEPNMLKVRSPVTGM